MQRGALHAVCCTYGKGECAGMDASRGLDAAPHTMGAVGTWVRPHWLEPYSRRMYPDSPHHEPQEFLMIQYCGVTPTISTPWSIELPKHELTTPQTAGSSCGR